VRGSNEGPERVTHVEVRDAGDLEPTSRLSGRLPKPNDAHRYVLRQPEHRAQRRGVLLARHTIHQVGELQLSRVSERFGTRVEIADPGLPYHCFTLPLRGRMHVAVPGASQPAAVGGNRGSIHGGQGGTAAVTSDGSARLNLWISRATVAAALATTLGETARAPLAFEPSLDWGGGCGPALRHLVLHLAAEVDRPGGIVSNPLALAAFTDLFAHSALAGLPHSYSARLARERTAASPGTLLRAEAFLHAHAGEPLRMEQVAAAAGCSLRALQLAFRRFRDTTPWAALQEIRLERARDELARDAPVAAVAVRWGFSCGGRFAAAYRRRFGELPAATRRRGGGSAGR
jgi:AraC-like DNA-binding protein